MRTMKELSKDHTATPGGTPSAAPPGAPKGVPPDLRGDPIDQADWNVPRPDKLPRPTYWPMVMAAGIVTGVWGLIFSLWFVALGIVLFVAGLAGWIAELRREQAP
jgi:hypothetical protein